MQDQPNNGPMATGTYLRGLGLMALSAAVAAATVQNMPNVSIFCMIVTVGLGLALLLGDGYRQSDGLPVPSGAASMSALYGEIASERASGRVYPFGNWLPRHRAAYQAWTGAHQPAPTMRQLFASMRWHQIR